MRKNKIPSKAKVSAHPGEINLASAIRKAVPFLFRKKRTVRAAAEKPVMVSKGIVRDTSITVSRHRTKRGTKKAARPPAGKQAPAQPSLRKPAKLRPTSKKAVASISVKKEVSSKPANDTKPKGGFVLTKEKKLAPLSAQETSAPASPTDKKPMGGFVLSKEKAAVQTPDESELEKEEGFMQRVSLTQKNQLPAKKKTDWSMLTGRFFSFGKKDKDTATPVVQNLDLKEAKADRFLKRTQIKRENSVVGTAVDEEAMKVGEPASALEKFAAGKEEAAPAIQKSKSVEKSQPKGRILSASDLKKEAQRTKEAEERIARDTRKEMEEEEKERRKNEVEEADRKSAETAVINRKKERAPKNGLQQFIASLGHIGMGKERMLFVQNLAMMLNAGLPLIDSLKTLHVEAHGKGAKKLIQRILDTVENGSPLWRAMDDQSFFSLHAIALVRIGEEAGNLAENMVYLAEQEEKDHALKSKVKMAMIYPSIVMVIMFIIVMGLGLFVLPNLIGVLYSLNVPLPFITRMVIAFTNVFVNYGAYAVPGTIGGFVLLVLLAKFTPLRYVTQWVMFRIPGIGRLAREATIARFGVILGGLLKAGVPVIEAMQSLVDVTPILSYRRLYSRMLDHIAVGDSFSKSFSSIRGSDKLLPPSVQQLVVTGEKSGALADIMLKIADIYDKKASETAQKLPVILEPMLLLFIGGLVGTIAFAIIVPIYSIVGTVGR